MKKFAVPKIDIVAWAGLLLGVVGTVSGVRGCITGERSAKISQELEFRTYIYEAADLLGAQPGGPDALDFRFDFQRGVNSSIDRNKFEQARRLLERASVLKPNDSDLLILRAIYYVGSNDAEGFIRELSAVSELSEDEVDAGILGMAAGLASMAANRQELAEQLYRKALHQAPNDPQLIAMYAMFLHSNQRDQESVAQFRKAISLQPQNARFINALAHVLSENSATIDAVAILEEALKKGVRSADMHNTLGVTYMSTSDYQKAALEFTSAVELGRNTGLYHYNLALALKALGRFSDADRAEAEASALGFSAEKGAPLSQM